MSSETRKLDGRSWAAKMESYRGARHANQIEAQVREGKQIPTASQNWRQQMTQHRGIRHGNSHDALKKKTDLPPSKRWANHIVGQRMRSGGRARFRSAVSRNRTQRGRVIGGQLKANQPRGRSSLTEQQRQSLPKTGHLVPKKGINATNWAYDHRQAVAARRSAAQQLAKTTKKGINAANWYYDHQRATAKMKQELAKRSKPTTHLSNEKRQTQQRAIATNQRPQQPKRPTQPSQKPPAQAQTAKRVK